MLWLHLTVHVIHGNLTRLLQLVQKLVLLFQLALDSANRQFEKLVLPLGLNDLILKEVFVLFESVSTLLPMFHFPLQLLLLLF